MERTVYGMLRAVGSCSTLSRASASGSNVMLSPATIGNLSQMKRTALTATRTFGTSSRRHSTPQTGSTAGPRPHRSMLYVPGSSEKMVKKAQSLTADTIIFDLEDSVADHRKGAARETVLHGISAFPSAQAKAGKARPAEVSVRINPPSGNTTLASDDLELLLPLQRLESIVVPKVENIQDIHFILQMAQQLRRPDPHTMQEPLSLILSIESAASLMRLPHMLDVLLKDVSNSSIRISSLLFASEDFCHSAGIVRTRSRRELLFPRQQMSLTAKAYGLSAIDMVCIDYQDEDYLREECQDGMEIGYDGKQAIHPAQVSVINSVFAPSEAEIRRAAKIKKAYEEAVRQNQGAVGVQIDGGQTLMIDAPMLKQANATLAKAAAANLVIPTDV
ncbi:unnamed protein product [Sympodiomycopsis kandeliae]